MIGKNNRTNKLNILLAIKGGEHNAVHAELITKNEIKQLYTCEKIVDALQIAADHSIDLIITDFYLHDGIVLDLLQIIYPIIDRQVPILVLVSENAYAFSLCAYRKGVDQVILKDKENQYLRYLCHYIKRQYKSNHAFRAMMSPQMSMNHGIIGLDKNLKIIFLNACALGYFDKKTQELIGQPILTIFNQINPIMAAFMRDSVKLAQTSRQPQPIGTFKFSEIEHNLAYTDLILFPLMTNEKESGFIVKLKERSIAEKKGKNYFQQHEYDFLTNLLHREAFLSRLEHMLSYCQRYVKKFALLHIDIDGFKIINNALGHRLADDLLKQIARRIKLHIRNVDLLARVGADEFMLLLNNVKLPQDAARVADNLLKSMREPFIIENQQCFVNLSIGIAIYPQDAKGSEEIIKSAGVALTFAKANGRNNYQFYKTEETVAAASIIALANDLHIALENDELDLYLQPQVSAKNYHLIGFEALIRWFHPERGVVSPDLFIPIAEQMGMINEIGRWVIFRVCEHINTLESLGYRDFMLAINVSIQQFMRDDFIEEMRSILADFHVDPHRIELEITESIFVHDKDAIILKLERLKSLGFQIMMDDFGTGYSSLSYLIDLPLDGIKIDRAFVTGLQSHDQIKYNAIVTAIITLAKQMNFNTLAEGIETIDQAKLLERLGCDNLQGYLFAKALPISEVISFLDGKGKKDDLSSVV